LGIFGLPLTLGGAKIQKQLLIMHKLAAKIGDKIAGLILLLTFDLCAPK
jgi:hypothetical protein